jgi:aquaporin Z
MRALAAEAFGTFVLVFAGTGAVVVNDVTGGVITHVGVAFTFGLVVLAMVYAVGDVSGAHLNPAVTVGFVVARRFPAGRAARYVVAQCAGAVAASGLLQLMFPTHPTLGATLPAGSAGQAAAMEVVLTLILMVVVLGVSTGAKEKGVMAGVAVGAVVALEALFGGPVSGASMNPARSLGPAVVSGRWESFWVYLTAPVVGALAGVVVSAVVHGPRPAPAPEEIECPVVAG